MSGYVDTTLISANRKQSVEYLGGNVDSSAVFTNKMGSGIKLNIGDRVSIANSFISEIGNESATIEVKGTAFDVNYSSSQTIGGYKYTSHHEFGRLNASDTPLFSGSYSQSQVTNRITDNSINLTYSFYKNTNGEFYHHLPRLGTWNVNQCNWNSSSSSSNIWCSRNASVNGSITHPNRFLLTSDYRIDYHQNDYITSTIFQKPYDTYTGTTAIPKSTYPLNDGGRYTIFIRRNFQVDGLGSLLAGHRDPALLDYIWYKQTKKISVNTGFSSPLNIADQFTNSLTATERLSPLLISEVELQSLGKKNSTPYRVNMEIESDTNKLFPVAAGINTEHNLALLYHTTGRRVLRTEIADKELAYESGYSTIAVKRPEIYESGTMMDNYATGTTQVSDNADQFIKSSLDGSFTLGGMKIGTDTSYFSKGLYFPLSNPLNEQYQNIIPTSLEWNDVNLNRVNKFLLAQEKYKNEIINYENFRGEGGEQRNYVIKNGSQTDTNNTDVTMNADRMRFCHLNCSATPGLDEKFGAALLDAVVQNGSDNFPLSGLVTKGTLQVGMLITSINGTNEGANQVLPYNTYVTLINAGKVFLSNTFIKSQSNCDIYFTNRKLGNDNYNDISAAARRSASAAALFFDYNPDLKDSKEGIGDSYETLYQGFGAKIDNGIDSENLIPRYTIGFRAERYVKGMPDNFWTNPGFNVEEPTANSRMLKPCQTSMGFDRHFNAFGTCAMCLYNGDAGSWDQYYRNSNSASSVKKSLSLPPTHFGIGFVKQMGEPPSIANVPFDNPVKFTSSTAVNNTDFLETQFLKSTIYLGANDPLMTFSAGQSRFQITRLHTPEKVGNLANAESTNPGSNAIVYKINKRLNNDNWTREMSPYDQQDYFRDVNYGQGASSASDVRPISMLNDHIQPFTICDSMTGITIEDYGVTKELWNKSLWGLMGFSYEQFHNEESNRNQRIFDKALTTSTPTTNAQITTADALAFPRNAFGVPFIGSLSGNIARQLRLKPPTETDWGSQSINGIFETPTIVQNCSSVSITAAELPKKMISPVYLIKSDLIDGGFIGGVESSTALPVMSVVPKNSGYGDFYNGGESESFTITHPRTITSIQTQICDADGTLSRVDDASLVVYKVEKEIAGNGDVISQILNPSPPAAPHPP